MKYENELQALMMGFPVSALSRGEATKAVTYTMAQLDQFQTRMSSSKHTNRITHGDETRTFGRRAFVVLASSLICCCL